MCKNIRHYSRISLQFLIDNDQYGYWGGSANSTQYKDVIGSPYFNVDEMDVTQNGNFWTVTLSGYYFACRQSSSCDGGAAAKLGPGDLYISTGTYNPTGDSATHYSGDTFTSAEGWNYVVPIPVTGEVSGLYALNFDGITMTNTDPLGGTGWIYRSQQAWRRGATGDSLGSASVSLGDTLTFAFDAGKIPFTGTMSFHWAMECGNDVVEGQVPASDVPPVPEPSTLILLGLGLTGIAAYRKLRS
jgi:hypothetical protein